MTTRPWPESATGAPARLRLGTQGRNDPAWVGPFYPDFCERSLRWTRPGIGADAAGARGLPTVDPQSIGDQPSLF